MNEECKLRGFDAAMSRLRPVVLAAATTVLGVVPLLQDVFWVGMAFTIMAGLAFGAKGAVGSTYNFMAPLYNEIIKDFDGGNVVEARKKQIKSVKIVNVLNSYGGALVAGKRLMKTVGIDCGNFLFPVAKFNENEYENFINDLKKAGFSFRKS